MDFYFWADAIPNFYTTFTMRWFWILHSTDKIILVKRKVENSQKKREEMHYEEKTFGIVTYSKYADTWSCWLWKHTDDQR